MIWLVVWNEKMKIAVVGKIKKEVNNLKKQVKMEGYKIDEKNPEIVISFGGDGSFLIAERMFPSVPKLLIGNKSPCNLCKEHSGDDLKKLLTKIKEKKYKIKTYNKIEARIKRHNEFIKKTAANDIVIRNREPYHALRFSFYINNKKINGELIGDGIIVSTIFGSTGYFESITGKSFKKGFGVGFNNLIKKINPLMLKDEDVIKLKVIRNSAVVSSDNDPLIISIDKNDFVQIKKSKEKVSLIYPE